MILFLLFILCAATDAKPTVQPGSYVVDGMQSMLYEFSNYEDPEIALFQLSSMGIMPILTVLQMAKEAQYLREPDTTYYGNLDDVKKNLDDVISRLQLAKSKLENGSKDISVDIQKALHKLMELDHGLQTDVPSVSIFVQEISSSNKDKSDIKVDVSSTQETISENTDFVSRSYGEKRVKTPLGDVLLIAENDKHQDVGKPTLRKKWTLKSSGKVLSNEFDTYED